MARMFMTNNPLPSAQRQPIVDALNTLLASFTDLQAQVKNAHWNVKGEESFAHHKLFDALYEPLGEIIDDVAERVATLGGYAQGTLAMAYTGTALPPLPETIVGGMALIEALTNSYATMASLLLSTEEVCDEYDDDITCNMIQDWGREVEKGLWFLESHLINV